MENQTMHYTRMYRTKEEDEYNRFADAGWRYITYDKEQYGEFVMTTFILGWPEGSGEPVYPPDPSIHWVT